MSRASARGGAAVHLVSFGYGHGGPPDGAHITVDVRRHFRDPHVTPALRSLTATDAAVVAAVLGTPGVRDLTEAIVAAAHAFRRGPAPGPVRIAVGCAGGRHRSPVIAARAAWRLADEGVPVTLTHRDLARPVITRDAAARS